MAERAGGTGTLLRRLASRSRTPATIPSQLTYDRVGHRYGAVASVVDADLDVKPGEIICLLGPSGCGKTTMLRLAAGVETPTAGRILIDGRDVTSGKTRTPPERRGVGLMFQDFALFPHLSNLANVMFGLNALPRAAAEREARAALARVGMADFADAHPHMLSGGEQQRVALARAVAPRPGVLLMDEPFSGLDRRLRDEVRDETLAVLRETRATCIVVTHDPEEALGIADRIALMRRGRLVQVDTPETIYRRPVDLAAARYFCTLNELPARVRGGRAETALGDFAAAGLADGGEAVVAIRPQGLSLAASGSGIPGRLSRRRFMGVSEQLEIAVEGHVSPLRMRVPAGTEVAVGNEVTVAIDPGEVLVFAAP